MDERLIVLVVPFSGGTSGEVAVQTAYIALALHTEGFQVLLEDPAHLKKLRQTPAAILQIGIGKEAYQGLLCLGELRLMYPETPRIVISEWEAKDVAQELNWDPKAVFLHRPYGGETVLAQTIRDAIDKKTAPSE